METPRCTVAGTAPRIKGMNYINTNGSTVPTSHAMAGDAAGEFSYTKNSKVQSQAISYLKPILQEEISQLKLINQAAGLGQPVIRVADMGCSIGANTLAYADIIFHSVVDNLQQSRRNNYNSNLQRKNNNSTAVDHVDVVVTPDVQYFFSDLPSNDFNTLFQQLQEQLKVMGNGRNLEEEEKAGSTSCKLFACAAPGSFYGRLVPARSLDVVICVIALHWISQVPEAVTDKASSAYNKGSTWIAGAKPEVIKAFREAAQHDLRVFFECRAHEVVSGGLVVLLFRSRFQEDQWAEAEAQAAPYSRIFEETWDELVSEGIIDEETRDSFNIPFYTHSPTEVREAVDSTNAFLIKRTELREHPIMSESEEKALRANPEAYAQFLKNWTKSVMWSPVVAHIGDENATEFFKRFEQKTIIAAKENNFPKFTLSALLVVLKRK